jgi:hypothetical protein
MQGLGLSGRGFGSAAEVVRHLTAMQAQEHPYARWSVGQRAGRATTAADVDAAFDDGRILRTHVLRPTWHYVARGDLRWLMALSGPRVDAGNATRYRNLGLDVRTRSRALDILADAVAGTCLTRRELSAVLEGRGISTEGQRLPHLVMHAELHSAVCSGPMRGKEHTYAAFDERVPAGPTLSDEEALAELAGRYFRTRGPATVRDFMWWAGLRAADARAGLAAVAPTLEQRVVDGRTYWFAARPAAPSRRGPTVDLVQCYDEVIISYTESRDVLATPAVDFPVPRSLDGFTHVLLLEGRLLGHWRVTRQGVETRVGPRLDPAQRGSLDAAIERYLRFLGSPTPGP